MKRILMICLTLILFVVSVIPVSATEYGGVDLPDIEQLYHDTNYEYAYIYFMANNYYLCLSEQKPTNSHANYWSTLGAGKSYKLVGEAWDSLHSSNSDGIIMSNYNAPIWGTHDLYDLNGSQVLGGNPFPSIECDGSSCPATDQNHDNVCDVCGNVLTLSLRSTLLEYAHAVIENGKSIFDSTEYWLVTEDPPSDGYRIFMSTEPFTYNPNTGNLISNGIVQRTTVSQEDDGSFTGGTSWASKQPTSYTSLDYGRPVDTSHDIEHFFPVTLWMEMTQVTETEMENLQGETVGTMKVLVACGVGLIALLVVLKLFGKRSLIFRD